MYVTCLLYSFELRQMLAFCVADVSVVEHLFFSFSGEVLRGDRIANTAYDVEMATNKKCTELCPPITIKENDAKEFYSHIKNEYSVHL